MKVRHGFVSNSSSSSFVCDLSGEVFGGYDSSLSDFDLACCTKGHTFSYSEFPEVGEFLSEDSYAEVPVELCPICNGKAKGQTVTRIKKLMTELNLTVDDIA